MKNPIALSWSRLSTYMECPMKFKAQYIDKDYPDDSDNVHFARGNRIHKQLEDYIGFRNGDCDMPSMSAEAQNAIPIIDNVFMKYGNILAERQLALDHSWVKCDWFAKPTVVKYRCIIDMLCMNDEEVLIIDFKTGKVREYEKNHGQLHLSTAMVFSILPSIKKITNTYLFVDHKQSSSLTTMRDDMQTEVDHFNDVYDTINGDTEFAPTKHKYCNYCLIKDKCPLYTKSAKDII